MLALRDEESSLLADDKRALSQLEMCLGAWHVAHVYPTLLLFANAKRSESDSSISKGASHSI